MVFPLAAAISPNSVAGIAGTAVGFILTKTLIRMIKATPSGGQRLTGNSSSLYLADKEQFEEGQSEINDSSFHRMRIGTTLALINGGTKKGEAVVDFAL